MTDFARPSLRDRVLCKAIIRDDGCIEWIGAVSRNGYGTVSDAHTTRSVHRVMYEMFIGPIPDGLTVDHVCHNRDTACSGGPKCRHRRCVNADHLELVGIGSNTLRSGRTPAAVNAAKTHCKHGHPFSPANTGRQRGGRCCRKCAVLATQRYQARKGRP